MSFLNKMFSDFTEQIKPFVNEIFTDVIGNIIAHKSGLGEKVMLIAHQDVVRLMITYIDDNGFLYVKPAGGIDASILPARKVIIKHGNKDITGIIGKKPVHLIFEEQNEKVTYESLWIDIGVKNRIEALRLVDKGDYAYFCSEYEELPNGLIVNSYFDDQIGLTILQKLAKSFNKNVLPWDLFFVASNHEEIGMRGAIWAAQSIKPDICICIDVTHATDYPTMNVISNGEIKLGEGCVLAKGPNVYPDLFKRMEDTAKRHKIKYQVEASPYPTGTDANMIQLFGKGVKTAVVSVPCRYMHTPYEVCAKGDIDSALSLIEMFFTKES